MFNPLSRTALATTVLALGVLSAAPALAQNVELAPVCARAAEYCRSGREVDSSLQKLLRDYGYSDVPYATACEIESGLCYSNHSGPLPRGYNFGYAIQTYRTMYNVRPNSYYAGMYRDSSYGNWVRAYEPETYTSLHGTQYSYPYEVRYNYMNDDRYYYNPPKSTKAYYPASKKSSSILTRKDSVSCGCNDIYDPVCGTDGKTYRNSCRAQCAGTSIRYNDSCSNVPTYDSCGTVYGYCNDGTCPGGTLCSGGPYYVCLARQCTVW